MAVSKFKQSPTFRLRTWTLFALTLPYTVLFLRCFLLVADSCTCGLGHRTENLSEMGNIRFHREKNIALSRMEVSNLELSIKHLWPSLMSSCLVYFWQLIYICWAKWLKRPPEVHLEELWEVSSENSSWTQKDPCTEFDILRKAWLFGMGVKKMWIHNSVYYLHLFYLD